MTAAATLAALDTQHGQLADQITECDCAVAGHCGQARFCSNLPPATGGGKMTEWLKSTAGHIYVLKPRTLINGEEVIKIGMTRRAVSERVRELTTGSLVSFDVAYSLHVEDARRFEKQLHAKYSARRLIAGGGQEFFRVPAQEVVAEIERVATEISREKASAACNKEIGAFLDKIGASAVANRIELHLMLIFFGCWAAGVFGAFYFAQSPPLTLLALLVLPIFLVIPYDRLQRHFMAIHYEPRFGAVIEAKHQELRLKYPLAYGIEPAPNPPSSYCVSVTFGSEK